MGEWRLPPYDGRPPKASPPDGSRESDRSSVQRGDDGGGNRMGTAIGWGQSPFDRHLRRESPADDSPKEGPELQDPNSQGFGKLLLPSVLWKSGTPVRMDSCRQRCSPLRFARPFCGIIAEAAGRSPLHFPPSRDARRHTRKSPVRERSLCSTSFGSKTWAWTTWRRWEARTPRWGR